MADRSNWWAFGVVPLAVLWMLGTTGEQTDVENDVAKGVRDAVGDGLDGLDLKVTGRDVRLRGNAFTNAGLQTAIDKALDGPRGAHRQRERPWISSPRSSPYVWSAERDGDTITLSGDTPDPATRAKLVAAAKVAPNVNVVDHMTYARGSADGLSAAGAFALGALGHFAKGVAKYSDGALALSGTAADAAGYDAALAAAKKPPDGVKLASSEVTPPRAAPFVFSASRDEGGLALSGGATSAEAKTALGDAAARQFPGAKIDNALALQSGAPDGEQTAAEWALSALSRLASGKAELSDTTLTVTGQAQSPGDVEALAALAANRARGLPTESRRRRAGDRAQICVRRHARRSGPAFPGICARRRRPRRARCRRQDGGRKRRGQYRARGRPSQGRRFRRAGQIRPR